MWRVQVTPYNFILPSVGTLGEPLFSYFVCMFLFCFYSTVVLFFDRVSQVLIIHRCRLPLVHINCLKTLLSKALQI